MSRSRSILRIVIYNTARFFAYFAVVLILVSLLFGRKITEEIAAFFTIDIVLPDTFKIMLFSSILFLGFTVLASAIAAAREQNHFKTSLVMRLILFAMNIVPIALFQHVLFKNFGFRILFFGLFYLFLQIMVDLILRPLIAKTVVNNSISVFAGKLVPELLVIAACLLLVHIPGLYRTADMRNIEMTNLLDLTGYFLYIVLFNSVAFFTVEYCISSFRDEYKKNYVKYYFVFTDNPCKRIVHILRNAIPKALEKIRKNLSWLIMFIIAVDSIFENIGSIGSNLLDGYAYEYGAEIIIRNVFYLLLIMGVINTIIDIMIIWLQKSTKNEASPAEMNRTDQKKISGGETHSIQKLAVAGSLVIYICLFVFNQHEYAFAGYYDFPVNMQRTVMDFLNDKKIAPDRVPADILAAYKDSYLCEQIDNPACFSVVQIDIQDENGKITRLIPYYDKTSRRYYFIGNGINMQNLIDIAPRDTITSISKIVKYKNMPFTNIMTSFRLQADTSANVFSSKPLYLIIPFYLFHFMTLLFVVVLSTILVYECIVKFHFAGKRVQKFIYVPGKISKETIFFLNSITLIVVFFLVNTFFEKSVQTAWINKTFAASFFSYVLVQLIITAMFSDSYINEITLHVKGILATREFGYYNMIGLNNKNQNSIFNKKYGYTLLLKLIFQNILFVININWFIAYAFNVWKNKLRDFIGITYSISFENIFTKIIHFESINTGLYNFIMLIVLDALLFIGYCYYEKKLSRS